MYDHIYIHIYREVHSIYLIVGGECVRGITHFALALPIICTCITRLHLHYSFALALPIICTCITHLHLHYPFALVFALPITLQL